MDHIVIRGARQHNLKNIDVTLPRNRFVVITGVSGSGKSTLAFDTLFAEGQRRYLEALSTRSRQFLQRLDAPKIDTIEGLSPAIAVEQGNQLRSPRSTVGTLTEIHDFLRLLYARLGTCYCPACAIPIRAYTIPQMLEELEDLWPAGSRLLILGPVGVIGERELPGIIGRFRRDGFARIRLEDKIYELDPAPLIPRRARYKVEVVVDRLILVPDKTRRLTDALELAAQIGQGLIGALRLGGEERLFSESLKCLSCGRQIPEPTPSLFSFNHPLGACPSCKGSGFRDYGSGGLPADDQEGSSDGSTREAVSPTTRPRRRGLDEKASVCHHCNGSRVNEVARSVRLGDSAIHEICRLPLSVLRQWLVDLPLTATQKQLAAQAVGEILHRLRSLEDLGLAYLTLDRSAITLAGGEMQRVRLAHQLSAPLSGILYILDEPSVGLHPRDHQRLLDNLRQLRDQGNTLVVVEHDRETILQADYVIDMGPGAGTQGGEVLYSGPPEGLLQHPTSLTGLYLSGRRSIPVGRHRQPFAQGALTLAGASGQNLKGITVAFPLGCITCVTGVSGSGKTTLVIHTLYRALARQLYHNTRDPASFDHLENAAAVSKVILVDQSPLGRTPRSTPATYSGIFSAVRELFAQLPEAKMRGYGPKRFSFNVKGGRCESCKGEGTQNIEMFFLPDVSVTCPDCAGRRYNRETLQVQFKGHSIADILQMSVTEALGLFGNIPAIARGLGVLVEVGLGYLQLGQAGTTLSAGEAQRVKLAVELGRRNPAATLYLLDEPTTGLHFEDIQRLLHVLQRLVDQGHTVIMIEHHPDVIKTVDYVIDLGPEGGDKGGYLVATGTPEEIAREESSYTGRFLRQVLRESGN
jgi:excinuclease ABC subunit A